MGNVNKNTTNVDIGKGDVNTPLTQQLIEEAQKRFGETFDSDELHNVGIGKFESFISSLIQETVKRTVEKVVEQLHQKDQFVTYKSDGGHGVAVPMAEVYGLLLSKETGGKEE